ncbi:hypothetical protein DQ04_07601030 [Trypanosoma grayi]|uniref:hypothetical protein n=1 Tax=Trypanosoma grayi TaxID=71804 RepID=UPI0004F3F356|nr:hypothetical protein DQ04_07601030 [Trypanosoma grayi]KEG08262.1 hypothetical protein DQ04_07601030 [Trypanosoma grayi]
MTVRVPRSYWHSIDVKRVLVLLGLSIAVAYAAAFVFVVFVTPSLQESFPSTWESPAPVALMLKKGCLEEMYRHFPMAFHFTTDLSPGMSFLNRQGCGEVSNVVHDQSDALCIRGVALHCHKGRVCSTRTGEEISVRALNETWMRRYETEKKRDERPWMTVNHGGKSPSVLVRQGNAVLSALGLAHVVARIENEMRVCRMPFKESVMAACKGQTQENSTSDAEKYVLVELGAGNANLLYSFCPPDPLRRLRCYGAELVPALAGDANLYQEHMSIATGTGSPLRDGSATHVLVHGVLAIASPMDGCEVIREGLRLLMPKGQMLIVMLFTGFSAAWPTWHHPFFFNDTAAEFDPLQSSPSSSILRYCSSYSGTDYGEIVEKVEFLWNAPEFAFYDPDFQRSGVYIVRLTRSEIKMQPNPNEGSRTATPDAEERKLYKDMCADPTKLDGIKDAQMLWAERVLGMYHTSIRKKIRKGHYIWVSTRD